MLDRSNEACWVITAIPSLAEHGCSMKLISVSIKEFRSIQSASRLPFSNFSVLVGPNNEGKSNILAAVVLALGLLAQGHYVYRRQYLRYRYDELDSYNWERDYPVTKKIAKPNGTSQVVLEFELDGLERKRFKSRTSINLRANLKVKVDFGQQEAKVDLLLSGPTKKSVNQKSINAIAKFVADSIYLQYIPAVRTADMAQQVTENLLSARLRQLEKDPAYQSHIEALKKLQQPVLQALSRELTATVQSFLPEVSSITVANDRSLARAISRATEISVNDGAETSLRSKGDGIKSLTAISLLRHLGGSNLGGRSLILAIEEPESHLHPRAIHRLKEVLKAISSDHQVILTTHCAVLVNRAEASKNIIVRSGSATPASSIKDVRNALGVEQSDNLSSARLILLVEGPNDIRLVKEWLASDNQVKSAMDNGLLALDSLDGVGNLSYKARLHKANISEVHAFVDNDAAAKAAIAAAEASGALLTSEYTATVCPGLQNTEIQDLVEDSVYLNAISSVVGIAISSADIKKIKGDWSSRIKHAVELKGKSWSDSLESRLKAKVCEAARIAGISSLSNKRRTSFDSLLEVLKVRISTWG